jgi:hypothetical protein
MKKITLLKVIYIIILTQFYGNISINGQPFCSSYLQHYWKLDDANSGIFDDYAGALNAVVTASTAQVPGILNFAQSFNGLSEANLNDDGSFDWNSNSSFSLEFWVNKSSACPSVSVSNNNVIIGRDDPATPLHWWAGVSCANPGKINFNLIDNNGSGVNLESQLGIIDGNWHHIVITRDGSLGITSIFIDGIKDTSITHLYTDNFASSAPINLGWLNLGGKFHFNGLLDELAVYSRALSGTEITQHYNNGNAIAYCDVQTPSDTLRIMPLGNSITFDNNINDVRPVGDKIAYRYRLNNLLINAGYSFDFVGSEYSGFNFFSDAQNAGFPGIRDDQMAGLLNTGYNPMQMVQEVTGPYLDAFLPDIILLHIGTNSVQESAADVDNILDEIDLYKTRTGKDTKVILARIINRQLYNATTTTFNNNVVTMAINRGDPDIYIVDMENGAGINYGLDMIDNLHPNAMGYEKMAVTWFSKITEIVPPPAPLAPIPYAVTGGGSYAQGGNGLPVGLADSETGTIYTLYKDGAAQVPTIAGTGGPITFGNQLSGQYTVSGTNGVGTTTMTGSAVITTTPSAGTNLALNKPATSQSSVLAGREPSKANDDNGTNDSYWESYQMPRWWKVDLGTAYDLTSVVIRNYVSGGRYYQYTIEASLDDVNYTQIAQKSNTNPATNEGDSYPVNVNARYLRVNMIYNSTTLGVHISDFRAYGTISGTPTPHIINATAGTGGSISPSGAVPVADGASQSFTITPAGGYQIADVVVDGSSVGAVTSYTFNNVTAGHTISATFTANPGSANVALNKPATSQSSILAGREPSKANDENGTNDSYWESYQMPRWWKVDLGAAYDLTSIVIRNYVAGGRYYQYTIEASLDDVNYTQIAQKTNTNPATNDGDIYPVNVNARYLRVNMIYNSTTLGVHISDFRAYGTTSGTPTPHIINATAGTGGSISPSGAVPVADGASKSFTITPAGGYQIADVVVDGSSVGAVTSYTFNNVTAGHTISATFTANPGSANVALNKPATSQSSILAGREPSKANDNIGTNDSYWESYQMPRWWKVDLGAAYNLTSVVIRNYVAGGRYYQYTIEASLDDVNYTQIAQKSNTNPATNEGDSYPVNVNARYLRVNMIYNSTTLGVHISDFRAYGTISGTPTPHIINASAGTGGSISPSGAVPVADGASQSFTITPAGGYQIDNVVVDGSSVGAVTSYTFNNVTASHTISATFTANPGSANVALNKPATSQSSILAGREPSKANDNIGTNDSYWESYQMPRWWKVDLGTAYDLTSVVIRNYVSGGRYYQYTIEASLDDVNYTQIAQKTNTNPATNDGDTYPVNVNARYLRVNMIYNSTTLGVHISDFRAYGAATLKIAGTELDSNSYLNSVAQKSVEMAVYPNPFSDHITVKVNSPVDEVFDLSILDLQGRIILNRKIEGNIEHIINTDLEKGIYLLKVQNKDFKRVQRLIRK